MKKFFYTLFAILAFVACSKSDVDNGDNNGGGQTPPKQPEITLSTTAADFSTDGGSNVITFTSSEAWTAQVVNSRADDWCSIEPTSGPAGSAKITVTTTENNTPDDRTASIIIKAGTASKTINVSQKQKDALTVTSSKFEVSAEGGEVSIEVKANIDFEYAIEESAADWVEYKATRALKTSNLVFEVKENDDTDKREAKIVISGDDMEEVVTIYQAGSEPSIILTENEFTVSSSAETVAVEVKSNVDVTVEIPNDVKWITENTTRAFSTNTYYFDIEQNHDLESRTAEIKFTNKENGIYEYVTVTQMQHDAIVVAKDSYTVDSEGDEIVIEVGHNIDFDVEIADDWITRKDTRAFVTDKLTFVIAANKGYDNRESTIKFTSKDRGITQTVKVYQAQENALIVSKKDIVVSDKGGDVEFVIQTNVEFTVSKPDVSWLREVTTRGLTSHTLRYEVDPNTSYDSREAKIAVTNRKDNTTEMITITQAQKDAIVLAKSEYELGTEGGELDFDIQTNVDITVTISDTAKSWITQVETRGLETKTLHFDIAVCSAEEDREGTITIAGGNAKQTITVKQSGLKEILEKEREALIAFYEATGGDNWTRNDNWCSDKPVSEWYGIYCNGDGTVYRIELSDNNLTGEIPESITNLSKLYRLWMQNNNLSGNIPSNIGDLIDLEEILLNNNSIEGPIPESITNLTKLRQLWLQNNNLSGNIPSNIGDLIDLEEIFLNNNSIEGPIPESITNLTKLRQLWLFENYLSGNIPENIGNLTNLEELWLSGNKFSGSIPESITNLGLLHYLNLQASNLSGEIPNNIGNLINLESLWLSDNKLSGSIPESLISLRKLEELHLYDNILSGAIPESFFEWNLWKSWWGWCILGNNFKFEDLTLPGPNAVVECFDGKIIDLENEYPQHKYTILFGWEENGTFTSPILPQIKKIYQTYSEEDVKIIGWGHFAATSKEAALEYIEKEDMHWDNFYYDWMNGNSFMKIPAYPTSLVQSITVIDSSGKVVFSDVFDDDIYRWDNYFTLLLENDFKGIDVGDIYESTDYSKDGEVKQLQKATKGKGIDVVLMGDAYTDRLIADGTYDRTMNVAMEKFFEKEPYKSFRDHFNVYSVTAVSKHDTYIMGASTALEGFFGEGTEVGGNDGTVFEYGLKAIGEERMDDALFVVMMNSPQYAGTCYMYNPAGGDWGNGIATAYFPVGTDDEALGRLMHHEAAGHGFAKLGDEYQYEGTISAEEIEDARHMGIFGWWKNIDFTSDPTKVKWSYFLSDPRYANEGLGVYEGSFTYSIGAYRPTENSIMRHNTGEFNAPSREAIYYRIHKLAYGPDWEYDYEEFVKWDEKNRNKEQTRGIPYRLDIPEDFQPTHPPVVINKSWRDAR